MSSAEAAKTLDLGCRSRKARGAMGVDRDPGCRPDVVHDLDEVPWPFPDDRFDRIVCRHILEHLRDIDLAFSEIHRVARHGARVEIVTPHFSSVNSWDDPTHLHHFSSASFDRYCTGPPRFRIVEKDLGFGRAFLNLIPRVVARCSLRWYEKHIAFIFPARNLTITLETVKLGTVTFS